jgi:hypothetical protein
MNSKILFILTLVVSSFFLNSCAKKGCTDTKADNYSSTAKTNDGSCVYSEKLIIWQDEITTAFWINSANISGLKIYVDGNYIGSFLADEFMTSTPDCNSNGQISTSIDLGTAPTKAVNILITDEFDNDYINTYVNVNAGQCAVYKITP